MAYQFRPLNAADQPFISQMLYEALFVPPGTEPFPPEIIQKENLVKYHTDFGKAGDAGWVVAQAAQAIGAAWYRFHSPEDPSYGFVSAEIPELNIALQAEHRGKGLGTQLLHRLLQTAQDANCPGISLSVDRRNPAVWLYQRLDFQCVKEEGEAWTMLRTF